MQKERWEEALPAMQAALAIDSGSATSDDRLRASGNYHVAIGRIRVHLGEAELAETDAQTAQDLLESAVRLIPNDVNAVQDLVRAYEFRGDLCEGRSEAAQGRRWFQRAQAVVDSHASMNIAAGELNDWTTLCKKLTDKTALAVTSGAP